MNPAPGGYPDPRPGHTALQAWWDGQQWHFGAARLTTSAEVLWWVVGIVVAMLLSVVFPPALVFALAIGIWWYSVDQQRKREARAQAEWYRQQRPRP